MSTQSGPDARRVVVTGLGFISSIGNNRAQVLASLREGRTGIEYYSELERPGVPVRLAGTVKEFSFPELRADEWIYPDSYKIPREYLRSMSPNAVYGFCAMKQAIAVGNSAYENLTKATKQATEMAEANVAAATESVKGFVAKTRKAA